jgi:GINS complex subunit 4
MDESQGTDAGAWLGTLRSALQNERRAPEILEYETDAVEGLLMIVEEQENSLRELADQDSDDALIRNLQQLEVDRIRHVVRSYLRARLLKLQGCLVHLLDKESDKLSPAERAFGQTVLEAQREHFEKSFLRDLPKSGMPTFGELKNNDEVDPNPDIVRKPETTAAVICRFLEEVGQQKVGNDVSQSQRDAEKDGTTVNLHKDHQYITLWSVAKRFVENKQAVLV